MTSENASPKIRVLRPSGILDSTQAQTLRSDINATLQSGVDTIFIDLADVTFMDSAGLGSLVAALKAVRLASAKLYIGSINPQIKMLFDLTGMYKVFEIVADEAEFYQYIQNLK